MQQALPPELKYSSIKPVGWYSKFKEWPVQPLSSNMYWWPNQILRFQFQLTNGVMDPYRSHMAMTVSSPSATDMPVGGVQVDTSAQSFISTMVISSRNKEIQRIVQYDTLAAYLTDIGFSQTFCQNRQAQGLGYQNYEISDIKNDALYGTFTSYNAGTTPGFQQSVFKGVSPTKMRCTQTKMAPGFHDQFNLGGVQLQCGSTPTHYTNTNFLNNPTSLNGATTTGILGSVGHFMNVRAQYRSQTTLRGYIDSTTNYVSDYFDIQPGVVPASWSTGGSMPIGKTYTPKFSPTANGAYLNNGGQTNQSPPDIPSIWGYSRPYSSKFGVGGGQPMLSPTIPQVQFGYGMPSAYPVPLIQKKFQFSLISSVMGTLIHADNYRLIPLRCLYDTLIQLTLNPYAMFSTGYSDVHQFDTTGMQVPVKRNYTVSRAYYNMHIYQWPQQYLTNWIQQSMVKQIVVASSSWALSGNYQIATGQNVASNSWQVTTGPQSMSQLVVLFLSNDYIKYPFCRKQYRLSNNIRTMQVKLNVQYFPPQPIVGNAGNPQNVDGTGDNYDFYQKLLLANNYKFVTNIPYPRINTFNFAVNGRIYDPSAIKSLYDPAMINNPGYAWNDKSVNGDTAMGLPSFHQNRCIGRAAFVLPFQPYGHSKNSMVGINTRQARPMEVNFDVYSTNYYPRDQTMYIFTCANVVTIYGNDGIRVEGR